MTYPQNREKAGPRTDVRQPRLLAAECFLQFKCPAADECGDLGKTMVAFPVSDHGRIRKRYILEVITMVIILTDSSWLSSCPPTRVHGWMPSDGRFLGWVVPSSLRWDGWTGRATHRSLSTSNNSNNNNKNNNTPQVHRAARRPPPPILAAPTSSGGHSGAGLNNPPRHRIASTVLTSIRMANSEASGATLGDSSSSSHDDRRRPNWSPRRLRVLGQARRPHEKTDHEALLFQPLQSPQDRINQQIKTLLRVCIPSLLAGLVSYLVFPLLALMVASALNHDPTVYNVISEDSGQFVQNFLTVSGLLFSILVGQTYYFLYTQQESIYYALFNEVTEAKSLLEQVALVCQGRSMYPKCLSSIARYVQDDLKMIHSDPAVLLSARPVDDPLESIMYMTSVGVPSSVYETVKSLREARARRLGALQRKLPSIHMWLLWSLAAIQLVSFPLLGAGTQVIGGYKLLTIEGCLFGVMTAGIVLTMRVVGELWRPAGGAYNVDYVLSVMVRGLEEELRARMMGSQVYGSSRLSPSGASDNTTPGAAASAASSPTESPWSVPAGGDSSSIRSQGADAGVAAVRLWQFGRQVLHVIRRRMGRTDPQ